jgi:hypothetical protein
VSGFQEHFLDKYFAYRNRYVARVAELAPHRRELAVLSEIARLGFMLAGNVLCGLVLWALAAGAAARFGLDVRTVLFVALALLPTVFAALTVRGLATAFAARGRGAGEAPQRGAGEAPQRGAGEAPQRGAGEAPQRGAGEAPQRGAGEEARADAANGGTR